MTEDELRALPRISSFFPLVFRTGGRWNMLKAECGGCHAAIEDRDLRGDVSRPFSSVFIVNAVGYCRPCKMLTPFSYRLHEDMGMTGKDREGEWVRWEPRRESFFARLLRKCLGRATLDS